MSPVSETRQRPRVHFTAQHGWTNDPHGILRVDGRFHMFFQYNPAGVTWNEACHWGQAVSDDLIRWTEVDVALAPAPDEIGCWSGSAVVDSEGPVLAYTRVAHDDWGRGAVALARPTEPMASWVRRPLESVLDGPPEGYDIIAFRDPQLRPRGDGWVAVIGAGLVGHGGCALQYGVTHDLTGWEFEGVLASRSNDTRSPVWSGKVWECPQFLLVDGQWVLLVSVWEDDVLNNVVYAIGDYDGSTFEPSTWGTFTHGPQLYATTTFTDADGRPTAMSWMREIDNTAPRDSPWCSAMSLPHRLSIVEGRLAVSQHPSLEAHFSEVLGEGALHAGTTTTWDLPQEAAWRLTAQIGSESALKVSGAHGGESWTMLTDAISGRVHVLDADGGSLLDMPAAAGTSGELDVVLDADILEICWTGAEGVGAVRVPAHASQVRLAVIGEEPVEFRLCTTDRG